LSCWKNWENFTNKHAKLPVLKKIETTVFRKRYMGNNLRKKRFNHC